MVKRRTPPTAKKEQQIDIFINAADDTPTNSLDPDAPRTFKTLTLPLNEYEFQMLDRKAKQTGRSRLNFIRWAISQADTD